MFDMLDVLGALSWGIALVSFIVFLLASDSLAFSHTRGNRLVEDKERYRAMVISGWLAAIGVVCGFLITMVAVSGRGY
ncbi:hypothetical protein HER39_03485 [Arthrobacter deserti]|uniref:DUF2516 domain-containing protein n=1 Tax=Arthrobacter deserti TaxID=1742687 RepID=A0ABX1JMP0_9MICC|nr:hypothetical protein [Arthrobacter deserti]